MKKFFAFLIAICLSLSLAGCDLLETSSSEGDYSKTIEEFEDKKEVLPHYYSKLSETEKVVYIRLLTAINSSAATADVPSITTEQLEEITTAISYDNPHLLWLSKLWTITHYTTYSQIEIPYLATKDERERMSRELDDKVNQILSGINRAMGDYEKELYFHDYLVANCQYDYTAVSSDEFANAYSAYGALVKGSAVCEGYSRAMQLLLSEAGIDSYLVTGTGIRDGKSDGHMWNVVNIDSGWYHLDATWDDPGADNSFDVVWHAYFNLTDTEISRDHTFDEQTDCSSIRANYYRKNSILFDSFNSSTFADSLADELYKANQSNVKFVELRFTSQSDFANAKHEIFDQQLIFVATSRASKRYGVKINTNRVLCSSFDSQLVIGIKF